MENGCTPKNKPTTQIYVARWIQIFLSSEGINNHRGFDDKQTSATFGISIPSGINSFSAARWDQIFLNSEQRWPNGLIPWRKQPKVGLTNHSQPKQKDWQFAIPMPIRSQFFLNSAQSWPARSAGNCSHSQVGLIVSQLRPKVTKGEQTAGCHDTNVAQMTKDALNEGDRRCSKQRWPNGWIPWHKRWKVIKFDNQRGFLTSLTILTCHLLSVDFRVSRQWRQWHCRQVVGDDDEDDLAHEVHDILMAWQELAWRQRGRFRKVGPSGLPVMVWVQGMCVCVLVDGMYYTRATETVIFMSKK